MDGLRRVIAVHARLRRSRQKPMAAADTSMAMVLGSGTAVMLTKFALVYSEKFSPLEATSGSSPSSSNPGQ